MGRGQLHSVLCHLHHLAGLPGIENLTDRQLLHRFTTAHDEDAFAALVRRHGAMVMGVCRRVLHNKQDAEDAFQAAFLVLARKAASMHWRESAANWLYGVAYRLAREAKTRSARRLERERKVGSFPKAESRTNAEVQELCAILDEELRRLSEPYRQPILLCYLESQTRDAAARQLGLSLRTLHRRLERGLELLRARLTARGLTLSAALLAAGLSQQAGSASSAFLLTATVRAALRFAAKPSGDIGVSAGVVALADAGVRSMSAFKVKLVAVLLFGLNCIAGTGALLHQSQLARPEASQPEPPKSVNNAPSRERPKQPRTDREGVPLPPGAIARLGTTKRRPMASELAIGRDGKTLITCGSGRVLRFWDVPTGALKKTRQLPGPYSQRVILSRDGKRLALEEKDGVSVWDVDRSARLLLLPRTGDSTLTHAAFSPDGASLATAEWSANFEVRLWNLATGEGRLLGKVPFFVGAMTFSPDGKRLVMWVEKRTLVCWEVATGKELWKRAQKPRGMAFSPDGRMFAVGDPTDPLHVRLIDAATGKSLDEYKFPGVRGVYRVHFTSDGKSLAISTEQEIVLWDLAAKKERHRFSDAGFTSAFASDGKSLFSLGNVLRRWDLATGKPLYEDTSKLGHTNALSSVAWSPDGQRIASIGVSNVSTVRLWSATEGRLAHTLPIQSKGRWPGWRFSSFTPDGKYLVSGGDETIQVWDAVTARPVREWPTRDPARKEKPTWLENFRHSRDGKTLTALTQDLVAPFTVRLSIWDTATRERRLSRPVSTRWPHGTVFSPDGRLMVVLEDATLYEASTGKVYFKLFAEGEISQFSGRSVVFSPNGSLIGGLIYQATPSRQAKGIQLWQTTTGKRLQLLAVNEFCQFAFTPDGRFLATTGADSIRLWEIATGKEVFRQPVPGHLLGEFRDPLAFAPDGRSLAIGLQDTTIVIWDMMPAAREASVPLASAQLDRLWADLAGSDAAKAYNAIGQLIARPTETLPLLRDRLRLIPTMSDKQVERVKRLLADLDSDQFEKRESSSRQLVDVGELVEPMLREALKGKPSLELRRRIDHLLSQMNPEVIRAPETLRAIRAVCVLEQIGTPQAKEILTNLAKGASSVRLTREANTSLDRLSRRSDATKK